HYLPRRSSVLVLSRSVTPAAQADRAEQGIDLLRRLLRQAAEAAARAVDLGRRALRGGRLQVVVGPLRHDPSQLARELLEVPLELGGDRWRHGALAEALDQVAGAAQDGLEDVGQVRGSFGALGVIAASGGQGQAEVN